MRKEHRSKLDSFADQLDHWFGVEKITLAQAAERLRELGCTVSVSAVSCWREGGHRRKMQERLLGDTTSGARQSQAVEQQLARPAPPQLETLLKLQRVLLFQFS